jgi:hypothetical protein
MAVELPEPVQDTRRPWFVAPPPPVPRGWTFWADHLRPDLPPIGVVQVSGFGCSRKLSGFGSGTATLALPCGIPPDRLLRLWSWRLWAFYDSYPWWCGIPTGIRDEGYARVTLTLTEVTGYLAKRVFTYNDHFGTPNGTEIPGGTENVVYRQVEQTLIASDLALALTDIGVPVDPATTQPLPRDRTYAKGSATRAKLLTDLSGVIDGPQFRSDYRMTPQGRPECRLRIGFPTVGTPESIELAATVPGQALSYTTAWSADSLRTRTWAIGDQPEGSESQVKPVIGPWPEPQWDLPDLDEADDWPGVSTSQGLMEKLRSEAARNRQPSMELSVAEPLNAPPLHSYNVGDVVQVRLTTSLLPGGLHIPATLDQIDVSGGEARATWTVTLPYPPPTPRQPLATRIDNIEARLRRVFRGLEAG